MYFLSDKRATHRPDSPFPPQVNDELKPKRPNKEDLTIKSALENAAANGNPEHTIWFMKNRRTGERGLVFASLIGQRGTLNSEQ